MITTTAAELMSILLQFIELESVLHLELKICDMQNLFPLKHSPFTVCVLKDQYFPFDI